MSNVIRADVNYVGTDQQGIIGKIYEDFHTDADGNTTVRYMRVIQAISAITEGDLVGEATITDVDDMYNQGKVEALATAELDTRNIYGVAVQSLAADEYGWAICKGVVDKVAVASGFSDSIGQYLGSSATAGEVAVQAVSAVGDVRAVIGYQLGNQVDDGSGADPRYHIKAYIDAE